jgi:hypothetical protein
MNSTFSFSNAAAVRELAGAGERLVCLQFPDAGLGPLYCHSCLLSFSSTVMRNVLEDTQQQQQQQDQCTLPLTDDSDVSVWKLALGLIYRLETATVTLDNAQALLLLAHKYDIRCITGMPPYFPSFTRLQSQSTRQGRFAAKQCSQIIS